jgi:acyl-CoA hydrolase
MFDDLNAAGTMFGGRLAAWIDEGAAIFAMAHMGTRRIVTRRISELVFDQPARLGDVLECWCSTIREGRSSLTVRATIRRRVFPDEPAGTVGIEGQICWCDIVFVAVDEQGHSRLWNKGQ